MTRRGSGVQVPHGPLFLEVVVVEGIETDQQLSLVRELGVTRVQGFLFGRPVDAGQFHRLWARPGAESVRVLASELDMPALQL